MTDGTEPVAPPIEIAPPLVGAGGQSTPHYTPPPAFVPPSYGAPARPSGQVPAASAPAGYAPPGSVPPGSVPPGSVPPGSVPPAYLPHQPPAPAPASPYGGASLPPYANQQPAATGYPYSPPPEHPAAAQYVRPAPPTSSGRTAAVVIGSVTAVLAVIALIVVSVLIATSSQPTTISAPEIAVPAVPSLPGTEQEPDSDSAAVADVRAELDAKIDEYRAARDSGELWKRIPDSDFNRTAVSAFLYLLTDMKVATAWGVDADTAADYAQRMADLEKLLLAEEPLGSDVTIKLSDRTFTYDGSTGEGGYTDD